MTNAITPKREREGVREKRKFCSVFTNEDKASAWLVLAQQNKSSLN